MAADLARIALFLASADAAYLNCVDIVVDGGSRVRAVAVTSQSAEWPE
jgi:NAD(P)-dependent dehydrogenase (short-subunit alcohol dehydrogenase family)